MNESAVRILILEGHPAAAESMMRELRQTGGTYRFRLAACREQFAGALREFRPAIILADHAPPGLDGLAALSLAQEFCPQIPFIFVTGALGEEFAVEALHRGATDYVLRDRLFRLEPVVRRALALPRNMEPLAPLGHQLRTPLTGILGMAELLAATPLDEQQQRIVATLRDSADTLRHVVERMLTQIEGPRTH